MKILVISDIHACASDQPDAVMRSYVHAGQGASSSPTESFIKFISQQDDLRPDVVICPGDLGDRADPTGIAYAWNFLNNLAKLSSKPLLLATAGNHDLDSRLQHHDYDAKGTLQDLTPAFPLVSEDDHFLTEEELENNSLRFWADNFYVVIKDSIRFVVLNSAAFHGYGSGSSDVAQEYEHGRISEITIKRLKKFLIEQNKADDVEVKINILICHHHLDKDGTVDDKDYSAMKGAHALVEMLSDSDIGRWLVIHGHRHRPRLYQTNDSTGPFVLSAASFGATKCDDPQNPSPNQAHLVIVDVDEMEECKFFPSGVVKTFSWVPGTHWSHDYTAGLPPNTCFGYRGSIDELSSDINKAITSETPVNWPDLIREIPKLGYLHYKQLDELKKCLLNDHSIFMSLDENKNPTCCGRRQ